MIITIILTKELVMATDQCTQYTFNHPFYPGESCEYIYNMNPESRDISGYYWITDGPTQVYCGMTYTESSCEDICNNIIMLKFVTIQDTIHINDTQWTYCNMTEIAVSVGDFLPTCLGVGGEELLTLISVQGVIALMDGEKLLSLVLAFVVRLVMIISLVPLPTSPLMEQVTRGCVVQ